MLAEDFETLGQCEQDLIGGQIFAGGVQQRRGLRLAIDAEPGTPPGQLHASGACSFSCTARRKAVSASGHLLAAASTWPSQRSSRIWSPRRRPWRVRRTARSASFFTRASSAANWSSPARSGCWDSSQPLQGPSASGSGGVRTARQPPGGARWRRFPPGGDCLLIFANGEASGWPPAGFVLGLGQHEPGPVGSACGDSSLATVHLVGRLLLAGLGNGQLDANFAQREQAPSSPSIVAHLCQDLDKEPYLYWSARKARRARGVRANRSVGSCSARWA